MTYSILTQISYIYAFTKIFAICRTWQNINKAILNSKIPSRLVAERSQSALIFTTGRIRDEFEPLLLAL